ncbi:MAG TPA: NADPH-dependent glutamate synthase [Candidatus Margulisiibacteriota bacterium]|nr:NADPH-dependent glutamate synthase [Candidatus Margulisiibacteriota bacterium]
MKETVKIKELPPGKRTSSFEEVVLGYSEEDAFREASRCLQCKNPTCREGCPVNIDIKKFIYLITRKDYKASYLTLKETNNFPSICGRVCPAEYQCQKACVMTKKGSPFASEQAINIHFLERFSGDYGNRAGIMPSSESKGNLSKYKVAVVGSGPAGLCCAGELSREGVKVTVFESLHDSGGVLCYGIPTFRLPRDILDFEIKYLKKTGVEIVNNYIIGKTKMLDELFQEGYAAIFLGLGAGIPSFLGVEGENLGNVYSANEFLTRVNLMQAFKFPEYHTPVNIGRNIAVIGGGNTAMDASRVALRLQKMEGVEPKTTVFYRRTEIEMPARRLEIEHAKEEGVGFEFLTVPVAFIGDNVGSLRKLRCLRCELGEPDSSGRRRPLPIEGSEFEVDCDTAIIALGLQANTILTNVTPALKVDKYKDIIVDPETMETSIREVYAGGDIVGGEGTVIEAMGMGKNAAGSILRRLRGA